MRGPKMSSLIDTASSPGAPSTVCIGGKPVYENVAQYLPKPLEARSHEWVSPVIVTVRYAMSTSGHMGNASRPDWFTLRIANGGLQINNNVAVYALVDAPKGEVIINGWSSLTGRLSAERLRLNSNSRLTLTVPFP